MGVEALHAQAGQDECCADTRAHGVDKVRHSHVVVLASGHSEHVRPHQPEREALSADDRLMVAQRVGGWGGRVSRGGPL